jgi:hypothetical protein
MAKLVAWKKSLWAHPDALFTRPHAEERTKCASRSTRHIPRQPPSFETRSFGPLLRMRLE